MDYTRTITVYQADGVTPDERVFAGGVVAGLPVSFEANYSPYGGCLGASLRLSYRQAIRQPFAFEVGQVVRVTVDGIPAYVGFIAEAPAKELGSSQHAYELRGLWDRIASVDVPANIILGNLSTMDVPNLGSTTPGLNFNTCGKIVRYILDNYLVPAGLGITYGEGDVVSDVPVQELRIRADGGTSLYEHIRKLALMADSAGTRTCYGVGRDGHFFFRPIPEATTLDEFTIGTAGPRSAREKARPRPTGTLQVLGGKIPEGDNGGFRSKKTWRIGTVGRKRTIAVKGLWREADLAKVKDGWAARHGRADVLIESAGRIVTDTAKIPWPEAGMVDYQDGPRGLVQRAYVGSLRLTLGAAITYEATLGLQSDASAGGDGYGPSLLEEITGGGGGGDSTTPGGVTETVNDDLPDVTDETDPSDEFNDTHESGPEVPYEGEPGTEPGGGDPGGETGTGLVRGQCVSLVPTAGAKPGDKIGVTARISNSGDSAAFDPDLAPVSVHWYFFAEANRTDTPNSQGNYALGRAGQDDGLETWVSGENGAAPAEDGYFYCALKVVTTQADPEHEISEVARWYPSQPQAGDYRALPGVRVINPSPEVSISNTVIMLSWAQGGA